MKLEIRHNIFGVKVRAPESLSAAGYAHVYTRPDKLSSDLLESTSGNRWNVR